MDMKAYMQIDDLEAIAKANNIEVPRLRGYRLMKDETPIFNEELKYIMKRSEIFVCKRLCCSYPFWNANSEYEEYCLRNRYLCNRYLVSTVTEEGGYPEYVGIRWDRIRGWKRKILKFEIKKQKRRIQKQFDMWNKYAGKENVLYIHARIGGGNWDYFGGNELINQAWFLDKVDDYFDDTYCDIYASIKPEESLEEPK